jgi:hypothetical protein
MQSSPIARPSLACASWSPFLRLVQLNTLALGRYTSDMPPPSMTTTPWLAQPVGPGNRASALGLQLFSYMVHLSINAEAKGFVLLATALRLRRHR